MEWQEASAGAAGVTATTGFLWLVFRFLVGSAMADCVNDISALKKDMAELKHTVERREDKLDQLIMQLANK